METVNTNKEVITLTENEYKALKATLNYDDREAQLSDNYSNAGAAEFKSILGLSGQAVGGVIASIEKKGLGGMDEDGVNGEFIDLLWLTEKGVNAVFDEMERRGETAFGE